MAIYYPDGSGGRVTLSGDSSASQGGGSSSTFVLPTASESVKGGVKIGHGLAMNGEVLNVTLTSGSSSVSNSESYGQVVTIPSTVSATIDVANAGNWAVFNQAAFSEQTGWSGNVYVVLPTQFATGNYTIEHVHNVSDYSTIYPKEAFIGTSNAGLGYDIVLSSEGGRYLLQIPATAVNWSSSTPQIIIHGERAKTSSSSSTSGGLGFVPGTGLELVGDTLNVTLEVGSDSSSISNYELPTMSQTVKGGAKVGHSLVMAGEVLNVALGTVSSTLEGAMWLSLEDD